MQADGQPEPLTASAYQRASTLAVQALEHIHQHAAILLVAHQHLSVHGGVRLPNIVGHVGGGREVDWMWTLTGLACKASL